MFGLFKNNTNLAQLPSQARSMAQEHVSNPGQSPFRPVTQSGWDMFAQRSPGLAAKVEPMLPQGMFSQPPDRLGFQPKVAGDRNDNPFDWGGAGEMKALPFGRSPANMGPGYSPPVNPFQQYEGWNNGTVRRGY